MPKLCVRLPQEYFIACSGGIDSMFALHFLNKPSRKNSMLGVIHINHLTAYAQQAQEFVQLYCRKYDIKCVVKNIGDSPPKGQSKECWWRDQRYNIFDKINKPIILAHHLDDCLEEYIMCTTIRGFQGVIPARRGNCVRPFRLWKRKDIEKYAKENKVPYVEDPSNSETKYKRNKIRLELVPRVLELNPGVYKLVERVIEKQDELQWLAKNTGGM